MKRIRTFLAALAALILAASAVAAQTAPPRTAVDKPAEKKKAEPPEPAAPKESGSEDPLKKIFGEKGFSLQCANGITFEQDLETGEVKFMKIQAEITLKSELINLTTCDEIVIDNAKQIMTATGKGGAPMQFSKDEMSGACGKLIYEMETKKTMLKGPPMPFIIQKDKSGNMTESRSETITIIETEKTRNVILGGKSEIRSVTADDKKADDGDKGDKPKEPATKIDGNSTAKIRQPSSAK